MVPFDVKIASICESQLVCIPCADVQVKVAILVVLLTDARFPELVSSVRSYALL